MMTRSGKTRLRKTRASCSDIAEKNTEKAMQMIRDLRELREHGQISANEAAETSADNAADISLETILNMTPTTPRTSSIPSTDANDSKPDIGVFIQQTMQIYTEQLKELTNQINTVREQLVDQGRAHKEKLKLQKTKMDKELLKQKQDLNRRLQLVTNQLNKQFELTNNTNPTSNIQYETIEFGAATPKPPSPLSTPRRLSPARYLTLRPSPTTCKAPRPTPRPTPHPTPRPTPSSSLRQTPRLSPRPTPHPRPVPHSVPHSVPPPAPCPTSILNNIEQAQLMLAKSISVSRDANTVIVPPVVSPETTGVSPVPTPPIRPLPPSPPLPPSHHPYPVAPVAGIAAAESSVSNTSNEEPKRTLVMSDSFCRNLKKNHIRNLVNRSKDEVTISKHPGATAGQIASYLSWWHENFKPDTLIVCAGANDLLYESARCRRIQGEELANEPQVVNILMGIGREARARGVSNIYFNKLYTIRDLFDGYTTRFNELLERSCQEFGFLTIDNSDIELKDLYDGLHVNSREGKDKLQHNIMKCVDTYIHRNVKNIIKNKNYK